MQATKIKNSLSKPLNINLGVPQGSVLGPLLFLIYINDLPAFLKSVDTTLFADDTTMAFVGRDYESAIANCKAGLSLLVEWCEYNYLYVNWSKTYGMFVTNQKMKKKGKKVIVPTSIDHPGTKIEIVSKFKLLGVTIDSKLSFTDHVTLVAKSINSKLFAIKKLFYLSFDVKLLFFKTFILPFFDYCLSLIFYFCKTAISKLIRTYYFCLYKLFKFKFDYDTIKTNSFLKAYSLFSFEYRIIYKLSNFSFFIKNQPLAPIQLKNYLKDFVQRHNYAFRHRSESIVQYNERPKSLHGEWSFNGFFTKFYNYIDKNKELFAFKNLIQFKQFLLSNIETIFQEFIKIFSKFNVNLNLNHIYF